MASPSTLPSQNPTDSFWLSEIPRALKGYRSSEAIPDHADVIIVGSGISGVFAARELLGIDAAPKPKVLLLEAREVCSGASGRNGGHCQPALYSGDAEITDLEMRTYDLIARLIDEHQIDCDWQPRGAVAAFYSKEDFDRAVAKLEKSQKDSPKICKFLQVVTAESQDPSLQDLGVTKAKGAIVNTMAASLWPYKLVARIMADLISANPELNVQTNTPVGSIEPAGQGYSAAWRVNTKRGHCHAPHVVLATNGYTSHLLPGLKNVLQPVRGNMVAGRGGDDLLLNHSYGLVDGLTGEEHKDLVRASERFIGDGEYLMQRPAKTNPDGTSERPIVALGGARFMIPDSGYGLSEDDVLDPEANRFLRSRLAQVLDKVAAAPETFEVTHEWSGILGYSKDGFPWVGELQPGLWLCGCYSGHGMPQAALCATHVASVIQKRLQGADAEASATQLGSLLPAKFLVSQERLKANGIETMEGLYRR